MKYIMFTLLCTAFVACSSNETEITNEDNATNIVPIAVKDVVAIPKACKLSFDVISNDTDSDEDVLRLSDISYNGSGIVSINADGLSIDYEAPESFTGEEVIGYSVSDGLLEDNKGTLTVTVSDQSINFNLGITPFAFTKETGTDASLSENQDRISDLVWITRKISDGQIYNIKSEDSASKANSPAGTLWALSNSSASSKLVFTKFRKAAGSPKEYANKEYIVLLVEEKQFISLEFTSWDQGGQAGFSYNRSTAQDLIIEE